MTQSTPPASPPQKSNRLIKWIIGLSALGFAGIGIASAIVYFTLFPSLPDVNTLRDVKYQVPMSIYSRDGKLIAQYGEKKRSPVTYEEIPKAQIHAFLAAEDHRFFEHNGVDYVGLLRAVSQLVLTGEKRQGGSTITMQVARNFFLTRKKTYTRKLREILLSFKIEAELSKQEILALYLNKIYMGHRAYGIAAAANVYYGKPLKELSLAQQAMIAGLPKAPSRFNPISNPQRAHIRRDYILDRMLEVGYIDQEAHQLAKAEPVSAKRHAIAIELEAPYVAEMARNDALNRYGEDIYTNGIKVYTSINSSLQTTANQALRRGLHAYDRRHGYRGIEGHADIDLQAENATELILASLKTFSDVGETTPTWVKQVSDDAIVVINKQGLPLSLPWEGMKWARPYISENRMGANPKKPADIVGAGDIIRIRTQDNAKAIELAQIPQVAGALSAIDPFDGGLLSLIGGYDYFDSKFNRAYQAKRQPGSGFKPFLYLAALEKGYTPATLINDAPVVFDDRSLESQWRPENYSGKFYGPTRLREAITHSRNLVSIRILRDIGIPYVIDSSKRFLFDANELPRNLSLALGSSSATPFQMASAYAILANGGYQIKPYFIDRIESREGEIIFQHQPTLACDACPAPNRALPIEAIETAVADATIPKPADDLDPSTDPHQATTTPFDPPTPIYAERVITPQAHFQITSLLKNVIQQGTARRALSLGRSDIAGKTGTTNEQRDAWFNGFHPSVAATAWVGFDDSRPLGGREVGGRAALPIWIDFMQSALNGVPSAKLTQPSDMVTVLIDPKTGARATDTTEGAIFEVFRAELAPTIPDRNQNASNGSSKPGQTNTLQQLF